VRTFVTGATGFIGVHVVRRLLQAGHETRCLIRKPTRPAQQLKELGATPLLGDVIDKDSVLRGMRDCEWVFHLAGLYSFWEPSKQAFTDVNVKGTRNVMECALETGVSKVVHVSSVVTYGKPTDCPFTEKSEVGPVRFSEYSKTKYEGDQIVWKLHREKGLPVVFVYPCAVLGAGDPKASGQYIANLINRRLPARVFEDAVMTFVHVKDVAEVIVRAAEKKDNVGEKYLVGNCRMSFGEINKMVREISRVPLPRLRLPKSLVMMNAALLTGLASLIKKPPPWGMSTDQMRIMREGFSVDGSKVEKELCIEYTPIRIAIEEAIASCRI
jgi:dihydroflavonol-4-reductase